MTRFFTPRSFVVRSFVVRAFAGRSLATGSLALVILVALGLHAPCSAVAGDELPEVPADIESYAFLQPYGRTAPMEDEAPFKAAVDEALRWLAAHQSPTGAWEARGFQGWCDGESIPLPDARVAGVANADYDVGATAMALMAFHGAGHAARGKHPYARVVGRGLGYLRSRQDADGIIRSEERDPRWIYEHAFATLALVEGFGMAGSLDLLEPCQRALDAVALARNPYFVWRYGIKPGDNDTAVTTLMGLALKAARRINRAAVRRGFAAPLTLDESAFDGIHAWLGKISDPDYGRVGYVQRGSGPNRHREFIDRYPAEKSESLTAAAIVMRCFMGEDPQKSKMIQLGADLCAKLPPTWNTSDGSIDMWYWFWGTQAMRRVGGRHWQFWAKTLTNAVPAGQRQDTDYCAYKGSWDPIGPWGHAGGRVYSTALLARTLSEPWNFARLRGRDAGPQATALEQDLRSPEAAVRAEAVRALVARDLMSPKAVKRVGLLAARDKSAVVRLAALRALGGLGRKAAPVGTQIGLALRKDTDPRVRVAAARATLGLGTAARKIVGSLTIALADADPQVRALTARVLGGLGRAAERATDELEAMRADADGLVRVEVQRALGLISGSVDPVLAPLAMLSAAAEPSVRAAALAALADLGSADGGTLAATRARFADDVPAVRLAALRAWVRLGQDKASVGPVLGGLLQVREPEVLRGTLELVSALGTHGHAAAEALGRVLMDVEVGYRQYVAGLLGTMHKAARPAALALLLASRESNPFLRSAASRALKQTGVTNAELTTQVGALFMKTKDKAERARLQRLLQELK